MTVTTEDGNRQNLFAREPQMYVDPTIEQKMKSEMYETHNEKAEKLNARAAMMGIIAALGAYALTGQIIPGIWWWNSSFLQEFYSAHSLVPQPLHNQVKNDWINLDTDECLFLGPTFLFCRKGSTYTLN